MCESLLIPIIGIYLPSISSHNLAANETVITRIPKSFWHGFTRFKAWFSANSCTTSRRQHFFTPPWAWRVRITDVWEMLNLSDNLRVLVKDGFVSTALSMSAAECVTINGRPGIPVCSWLLSISLNLLNQYWTVRTATVPFPSTWHIFRRVSQ